jgi:hypothetical protein
MRCESGLPVACPSLALRNISSQTERSAIAALTRRSVNLRGLVVYDIPTLLPPFLYIL